MSSSRAYSIWENMLQRCFNPHSTGYSYYGGRGVSVCEDWRSFENFYADMLDPPVCPSIASMSMAITSPAIAAGHPLRCKSPISAPAKVKSARRARHERA
jgi:hypothetical protein